MLEWTPIGDSDRVAAVAYDKETQTIYVEFHSGTRWWYSGCPPEIWDEFNAPAVSKGRFIREVLDEHPNGRFDG